MFRLLLVEDEYIEREAMKHVINHRFGTDYEIKEAANGFEAVEIAKEFKPEIIFLDIKMPGCSGIEAARQIREFLPDVHMIFITAYDYFDYAKEAISIGVDEFLLKPVDVDEVCNYIEKVTAILQTRQMKNTHTEKMEQEFAVIKKKFQTEFKELLHKVHASEESIKYYLKVMDIKMGQAVIGLIDFTTIEHYEEINSIQKEFIKERLAGKLEQKCQINGIVAIIGDLRDLVTIVFILDEDKSRRGTDMLSILSEEMKECVRIIGMSVSYQLSEVITEAGEIPKVLYREKQRLFDSGKKEKKAYPFELEDKIIESIRKKEFDKAKQDIAELAGYLENACEFLEFKREIQGLYSVIERTIRRSSPELLLNNADKLAEDIGSYSDMVNFYEHLFVHAKEVMEQTPDRNKVLIQKVCKYLEAHYNENISLDEAASMIGFSPFYFTKLMREHMNMSYVDYITAIRIEKAKQLLETTEMAVKDVGMTVGYENANYFTRVFKRIVGTAPNQYKGKFK